MKYSRILPLLALALGFFQLQCLLVPDDTRDGEVIANKPPSVRITAGAATADTFGVDYKVTFRWNGVDEDGIVSLYQFAIDDTVSESAWRDTTGFSALVKFTASTIDEGDPERDRFTDWHTFYVRAVDNENAVSASDKRFFNARTIAPTSEITFPTNQGSIPRLQRTLIIRWDGEDLDSSDPDRKPVAWEYKLTQIGNIVLDKDEAIIDSLTLANNLLLDTLRVGDKRRWIRVPSEERSIRLSNLTAGDELVFAVRAVDEAGAVEPLLERNRNFLPFIVRAGSGVPLVTMGEPTAGSFTFGEDGEVWDISVPSGRELRFSWVGDAAGYGSEAGNSNYALDIPDPENESIRDPNGVGGWIGWGTWSETVNPISFGPEDAGTTHNFWVKMRDISDSRESERICQVRIFVVPFTFERLVLIVDDSKFPTLPPNDQQHDEFMNNVFLRRFQDFGLIKEYPVYGTPERSSPVGANNMELQDLAQYQHVVWHTQVATTVSQQPLWIVETNKGFLSSYLAAGGRLLMTGGRLSSFLVDVRGDFTYPKEAPNPDGTGEPDFQIDSFVWKFMRMRNELVSVATRGPGNSTQRRQASGLVELRSQLVTFPDIPLDFDKRNPWDEVNGGTSFRGGIVDWEGFQGNQRPILQMAGLDTIYTPVTMDTTLQFGKIFGGFDDAVVGWRYESTSADTAAGSQQGRTVVLDFQPYWFDSDAVGNAGTASINWLRTGQDH